MATFRGSGTPGTGDNFPTEQDLQDAVTAAELAETNAAASELAASTSEGNAATSETNSAASAAASASSATDAETAQTAAELAETNAETAETNAETAETGALAAQTAAEAALDEFDDLYLGTKASDPTLDNDGDALQTGALYFNSTNNVLRVYDGASWNDAGQATANFTEWTATAGQTVFTGADDNGLTLAYKAGFVMVFHNGSLLDPDDYTATDGSTVTLDVAALVNDTLNFVGYGTFDVANTYTKAEVDANTYTKTQADATFAPIERPNKNLVVNGDMRIWQRGISFPTALTGKFCADRWKFRYAGSGRVTLAKSTSVPAGLSGHSLHVDVTTVDTSPGTTDFYILDYNIEGYDAAALQWDSASPKDVTVSFWVRSSNTGTHVVTLRNSSSADAAFVHEYTVDAADTWQKIVVTIPGPVIGTWNIVDGIGLYLTWVLAMGSSYDETPEAWANNNQAYSTSGNGNLLASTSNDFRLKDVKVEVGATATDFVTQPFSEDLARCQRYYCKSYNYANAPGTATAASTQSVTAGRSATTQYVPLASYPVTMRAAPTVSTWSAAGVAGTLTGVDSADLSISSVAGSDNHQRAITTTAAFILYSRYQYHWAADAEL